MTKLWECLGGQDSPEADAVRTSLNQCMPMIQHVLAQGGTAALDFTLHDSGHAFRVAQRMTGIIPSDVLLNLSAYELAMLLLSAYLHDIGMTPERRKVSLHHSYLLTGDPQDLSQDEINKFQEWLDNEGSGIVPPLTQQPTTTETLRLAGELITYYCRHRHNDWSEEWIKKNLSEYNLGTYVDWIDDLVTLCCSHHYGYHELVKEKFDPRPIGSPARVVHLRYLACVLRIADVLEFDPERTPDVILRHRDISPDSLIYWWKDHHISMVQEDNRLFLSARPPKAYIHRAIEMTADQVDDELRLCRTLADETHFEICPGLTYKLPHRWNLLSSMHRDITSKDETYEYINGAFRPDTKKLLELLSGVELYGNQLAAVRELLQNAFDAVREQMAYERLGKPNPQDSELEDMLSKLHQVDLRLETSPDGVWLICTDDGVGMTKAIIRDHLLVNGTARRHDLLDLERRCKDAGFSLGRTGQFGIGVLSYFMIANKVIIRTRRGQEAGDTEATGWHFETEGIGSFGELRRDATFPRGTEVRLRLRANIVGDSPAGWYSDLRGYLKEMMARIPCKFELGCALPECESLSFSAGWSQDPNDFFEESLIMLEERRQENKQLPPELLSHIRRQEREAEERDWEKVVNEMRQCIRWETHEGKLPEGLGRYRIHLPYFALLDGESLAFLRVQKANGELLLNKIGGSEIYYPQRRLLFSWKGMSVKFSSGFSMPVLIGFCEVDWISAVSGEISVNRGVIKLSDRAKQALDWLDRQVSEIGRAFLQNNKNSAYALLNSRVIGSEVRLDGPLNWLSEEREIQELKACWKPLRFPCINGRYLYSRMKTLTWKDRKVFLIPSISVRGQSIEYNWNPSSIPPDRIMVIGTYEFKTVAFWARKPKEKATHVVGLTCRFPTNWSTMIGVRLLYYSEGYGITSIWNLGHPILRAIDASDWEWAQNSFRHSLDPLPLKGDVLKHKSRAASWLIHCLNNQAIDLWDGLKDRDSLFLEELWGLLFKSRSRSDLKSPIPVCQWIDEGYITKLNVLTPEQWSSYDWGIKEHREQYLPDPGPEWRLEIVPDDAASNSEE